MQNITFLKVLRLNIRRRLLIAFLMFFPILSQADVAVIVGKNNNNDELDAPVIARIFLGKTSNFPDGALAIPVDQSPASETRDAFTANILGKTSSQLKAYWSRLIFTGRGSPPVVSTSDTNVKNLISTNPNLIGYIDDSEVDDSVKVVYRFTR